MRRRPRLHLAAEEVPVLLHRKETGVGEDVVVPDRRVPVLGKLDAVGNPISIRVARIAGDSLERSEGDRGVETDLARVESAEMQKVVAERGMFTDGTTLDQVLTPAAWTAAQEYAARSGMPVEHLKRLKPWLFVVLISATELRKIGVTADGVDVHYEHLARADGRPRGELESFEQHIDYIVGLGQGSNDPAMPDKINAFAEKNLPEASRGGAKRAVAIIGVRRQSADRMRADVTKWVTN